VAGARRGLAAAAAAVVGLLERFRTAPGAVDRGAEPMPIDWRMAAANDARTRLRQ